MNIRSAVVRATVASLGALALAVLAGAPAAWAQAPKVLKFIPQADLRILDPITTTAYITRNHGYMIYDTLFATDAKFQVQPQMVDKYEVSKDQLNYTFTLRDGLKFHDGQPVRSADCIASIERWAKRDALGQKLAEVTESWKAINDKTFTLKLKRPFPLALEALAKPSSNVPFIMPERIAKTDASTNITEAIGSGPFKFVKEEWVPGSKVVYVKNTDYVPRKEPPSWAAGGKIVKVDRVEWIYIPDSASRFDTRAGEEQEHQGGEHRPARFDGLDPLQFPEPAVQQPEDAAGAALRRRPELLRPRHRRRPEERAHLLFLLHLRNAAFERGRRRADEGQT
jgi:peptide/nickel transport system substrate-binding protein